MSSPFPPEILCEIALHLPLTEDVISFSLTNHAVRAALSTPVLFKARLVLQRWDIDAWEDEDDKAQRPADWKRWIRIDYIHSKTSQLLEEVSADGLLPPAGEDESFFPIDSVLSIRNTRIHFSKAENWSRRLSKVFPSLITHHRLNNIPRVTETKHCGALRAYLMVVTQICLTLSPRQIRESRGRSTVAMLERGCFGLAAFVMQCNAKTIESVFGDAWTVHGSPDFAASLFKNLRIDALVLFSEERCAEAVLEVVDICMMRYTASFLIQIKMRLWLHFHAAHSAPSLLPPSIAPMNPASHHDGPYELGSAPTLWPWLRDGLAGTPLAGPSSASGHRWAGYYTYSLGPEEIYNPPMFFKLYLAPPPAEDEAGYKVYFSGEGADSVGQFTLEGSADTQTGAVVVRKTYVGANWFDWYGVITPFGMVGAWLSPTDYDTYGWWWMWPQEWSEGLVQS